MITEFKPANLKQVRAALNAAIAPVAKEFGITLTIGNITYFATEFRSKLTGNIAAGSSAAGVKTKNLLQANLQAYLEENAPDLKTNCSYEHRGKIYKLIGFNSRAYKTPLTLEREGKQYRVSIAMLRTFKVLK